VKQQLEQLCATEAHTTVWPRSVPQLFLYVLRSLRRLVVELAARSALQALIVLAAVIVAREVFQGKIALDSALGLVALYLFLKLAKVSLEYSGFCRRLQLHRGIQIALLALVNEKLSRLSPVGRAAFSKGQLKTLVGSDVESVEDFLSPAIEQWVSLAVSCVVVVPALLLLSGAVGVLALLAGLALVPIAVVGSFGVEFFQRRAQALQDRLATVVGEWVKNIRLVRFVGWSRLLEGEVQATQQRYILLSALRHAMAVVIWALSSWWTLVPLLALFILSSLRDSPLNLVEVFSSFWLLDHLMVQVLYIPVSITALGAAVAGGVRLLDLFSQPELADHIVPVKHETSVRHRAPPRAVALVLRNLSVRHGAVDAIVDFSTRIELTQRTAIVGAVGSGKTSLLEALIGELPCASGEIEVEFADGTRGPLWQRDVYEDFRSQLAYSPQQPFLSNSSLALNIDLSGLASPDTVQMAVMAAQLSSDLLLFPRGLQEEVGESGINLSGGQRQRVSLARAFLSMRPLLVLDDPLSAVDPNTERALMAEILQRSAGLIIVSHRLGELYCCDRVLVLEQGRVVEDGEPAVLAQQPDSSFRKYLEAVEHHGE
jgi:ABC-type multidrug transport system fused ATPase/permease subunit